jgi:flagellar L-ring protein precursor FlgH
VRAPLLLAAVGVTACASPSIYPDVDGPTPVIVERSEVETRSASLWNQEPQSLFGNRRARNVGDILTVIVSVDEAAEMQNSLQRSRSNEEDFSVNSLFGVPEWANPRLPDGASLSPAVSLSRNAAANGDGSIARQERITLSLAAQVVEQLPNGHLVVLGTQRIRVNHETRDLRLHGIVRPEDITRDNTITHDKIAAADIVYSGQGQISRTTRPRVGSRVLDILVPF